MQVIWGHRHLHSIILYANNKHKGKCYCTFSLYMKKAFPIPKFSIMLLGYEFSFLFKVFLTLLFLELLKKLTEALIS